tara:strand:- start:887 stop:1453 length:567 start_codon:yes stop_codon:yes gene_type:complete
MNLKEKIEKEITDKVMIKLASLKVELNLGRVELNYIDDMKGILKRSEEMHEVIERLSKRTKEDIAKLRKESKEVELAKIELKDAQAKVAKAINKRDGGMTRLKIDVKNTKYSNTIYSQIKDLKGMLKITERQNKQFIKQAKDLGLDPKSGPIGKMFEKAFKLGDIFSVGTKSADDLSEARSKAQNIID